MLEACLQCGICSDNCFLEQIGIRSFINLPLNGDTSCIWNCSNCWTCQDICPVNIPLMEIKWQEQQKNEPPPAYAQSLENIFLYGYCLPVNPEEINSFRLDDNLEPIRLASPGTIAALLSPR